MIRPVMSKFMICCGTIAALAGCKTQKSEQKSVEEAPAAPAFESEDTSLAGAATSVSPGPAAEGDLNAIITGGLKDTKPATPMPEAASSFSKSSAAASSYVTPTEKRDRFGNVYKLDSLGNLYRYFGGTLKCQVTNNVLDFKINMHPADEAIVYLVRNEGYLGGVLYALMDSPTYGDSQCPKSNKLTVMKYLDGNVNDKYKIVSNLNDYALGTTVSAMALNYYGDVVGWRGKSAVFTNNPVYKFGDLVMNTCYGDKNSSFSSYVAFLLEKSNGTYKRVAKIKGRNTAAESKFDTYTWKSIQDFKAYYNVCARGSDVYPQPPQPPQILSKIVECSSRQYKFAVCDAGVGYGYINSISMVKQLSWSSCTAGVTYGADSKSIWVADGCRAQFKVYYQSSYY